MSHRDAPFVQNEFYHLYDRGNSKQVIFKDRADYKRFSELLYLANTFDRISMRSARRHGVYSAERVRPLVAIGAYCLMPNHYHMLLTPLQDEGVSVFMKKIMTGYVMYFNKRHERTGGLFEGKFKSRYINNDQYLKYTFSYIHLNPLRLKHKKWYERVHADLSLLSEAKSYPHSSYRDYVAETRDESKILEKSKFPIYFADNAAWDKEMLEWIQYQPK